MRFDPTTPTELQRQDWTCAIRSTMWLLKSIGIAVTPEEAQDAMSPRYVNSDDGLRDASGAGIVAVLAEHWGVQAINDSHATFDEIAALAGRQPVAIGLRNWGGPGKGHWSGVRGVDGDLLVLANPAGTGPVYGQQTLSREQFDARGPASMVTVPLVDAAPASETLRGVDVASWQGNPDWAAVAASGVAFAITKVTEDDDYLNPTFARNWREIKANGLVRGAYHFGRPEGTDAVEEAEVFVSRINSAGGLSDGDLLALDLEAGDGDLGQWALDFLRRVEMRTGITPLVYTGAWFSDPHELDKQPALARYPLWLAAYQNTQPPAPEPWDRVAIWQFSDNGSVPGIAGPVDLNRFNGSRADLLALGKGGSVAEPEIDIDPRDKQISGLLTAVAELADVVVEEDDRAARLARAQEIREQFVGKRPAA